MTTEVKRDYNAEGRQAYLDWRDGFLADPECVHERHLGMLALPVNVDRPGGEFEIVWEILRGVLYWLHGTD